MPSVILASPWVSPDDATLKQHIQVLSDANIIRAPITTYPLMWSGIAQDINQYASNTAMTSSQRYSLAYVRHELDRAQQTTQRQISFNASSGHPILNDFGNLNREQVALHKQLSLMGDRFAGELNVTSVLKNDIQSADHSTDLRLDGSYIAALFGNWAVAIGSINRWWGPAQSNSLILSTNARPSPGIMLQRNYSDAFTSPWLSWIGPWQLTAFANQLEGERHIPRAKLLGMRFSFKPLNSLEIGLNRTAQWGGKNRPESLSSLKNLLLGKDNRGDDVNLQNEPGNQLAGIDWRFSDNILDVTVSFYGQFIGEDEAGGAPSRFIDLLGFSSSFELNGIFSEFSIEHINTSSESSFGKSRPNYTYEHDIYKTGYRHYGRSIGASFDNDSQSVVLMAQHRLNPTYSLRWSIADYDVNKDGSSRTSLPFSSSKQTFTRSSIGLTALLQNTKIQLDITRFNKNVTILGQKQSPLTVKVSLAYRY